MCSDHEDHMTDEEKRACAELPRDQSPGRAVEDRIVHALKDRGLLDRARPSRGGLWWVRAAAATLVLFGGGVALGEYHAERRADRRLAVAREQDARDAAMHVQQTGSAYVEAVARLAEISVSGQDAVQARQGREVAMSALEAAATELHQAAPDDPFTARLLDALAAGRADSAQRGAPVARRVIFQY